MAVSEQDIDNIRKLEAYLKTPHTAGDIAKYLGISTAKALDYLEVMIMAPKRYKVQCTDLGGVEKAWVIE